MGSCEGASGISTRRIPRGQVPPRIPSKQPQGMTSSLPSLSAGPASSGSNADLYEETHVHDVYEAIAPHFSATRHKPWPFVSAFLASQPPGSVGLDVGCGNGKNMGVNHDVVILGCDRSAALVALARDMWCCSGRAFRQQQNQQQPAPSRDKEEVKGMSVGGHGPVIAGADVAVADGLVLPFREGSADFVICIAVIHHLSTKARRIDAIRQLLRCIRRRTDPVEKHEQGTKGGQILVYVWALEQSSSRRGWDEGGEQDLLVPWVMKAPQQKKKQQPQQQQQQQQQGQATKVQGKDKTKNKRNKGVRDGRESQDALTTSGHATLGAATVGSSGSGGSGETDRGEIAANNAPETNDLIPSSGEGGEAGRDAVAMQGHRQESHSNDPVVRSRDMSRETAEISEVTVTTQGDQGVNQRPGKEARSDADADVASSSAVEDNAKRADDGQQQQVQGQGQGQGSREKQQRQQRQDEEQGITKAASSSSGKEEATADKTFHRFYHLYKKGELEEDVAAAGGQVLRSGYERDNWWVIAG